MEITKTLNEPPLVKIEQIAGGEVKFYRTMICSVHSARTDVVDIYDYIDDGSEATNIRWAIDNSFGGLYEYVTERDRSTRPFLEMVYTWYVYLTDENATFWRLTDES